MLNLTLLTVTHGRNDLSERSIRHHSRLAQRLSDVANIRIACICSPEDLRALTPVCSELGVFLRDHINKPVSRKWQRGLDLLADAIPTDAVMLLGSDDFASEAYLRRSIQMAEEGNHLGWGVDTIWFYQWATGRLGKWVGPLLLDGRPIPSGAGRVLTRKLLDAVNWVLWPREEPLDKGLDTLCSKHLRSHGIFLNIIKTEPDEVVVDVKDGRNIHTFSEFNFDEMLSGAQARQWLSERGLECV